MKFRQPTSIDAALLVYYANTEIGNKQIRELFGNICNSTIARYKKAVLEQQAEDEVYTTGFNTVDTKTAYKVWGIDVDDLEKRRNKLRKLGLTA